MKISLNKQQWFTSLLINTQYIVAIHTWLIWRGFEVLDFRLTWGFKVPSTSNSIISAIHNLYHKTRYMYSRHEVCFGGLIHNFVRQNERIILWMKSFGVDRICLRFYATGNNPLEANINHPTLLVILGLTENCIFRPDSNSVLLCPSVKC